MNQSLLTIAALDVSIIAIMYLFYNFVIKRFILTEEYEEEVKETRKWDKLESFLEKYKIFTIMNWMLLIFVFYWNLQAFSETIVSDTSNFNKLIKLNMLMAANVFAFLVTKPFRKPI